MKSIEKNDEKYKSKLIGLKWETVKKALVE